MVRVNGYDIIIKPALVVLLLACLIAAIAIPAFQRTPAPKRPAFGYLRPDLWQFRTKAGAEATVGTPENPSVGLPEDEQGLPLLNMETGVSVNVTQVNGPESVRLVSGINLAEVPKLADMRLRFEARSEAGMTVRFAVYEFHRLLWNQAIRVRGDWQTYAITVPLDALKDRRNQQLIVAAELAHGPGEIALRKIRLTEMTAK
ncbi:MAG: hypothetical protein SFU56_07925 [Capsulimonadales bacterium]|nr:hypothetical protein [Capsulimonadales bacterium]